MNEANIITVQVNILNGLSMAKNIENIKWELIKLT